jgi:hypothetical protein
MNTNIGLIGLTLASFILIPMMPVITGDSSQDASNVASWSSQVYSNLDGIHQDYDFQQFAPDLNGILTDIIDTYNEISTTALDYINAIVALAQDPFGEIGDTLPVQFALNFNKLNSLTNAQTYWDTLSEEEQDIWVFRHDQLTVFLNWFYYSPTELDS